jgi:hypothetical protein
MRAIGGLLSVALSLGFGRKCPARRALPATLVSWSPDFPRRISDAAARPPGAIVLEPAATRFKPVASGGAPCFSRLLAENRKSWPHFGKGSPVKSSSSASGSAWGVLALKTGFVGSAGGAGLALAFGLLALAPQGAGAADNAASRIAGEPAAIPFRIARLSQKPPPPRCETAWGAVQALSGKARLSGLRAFLHACPADLRTREAMKQMLLGQGHFSPERPAYADIYVNAVGDYCVIDEHPLMQGSPAMPLNDEQCVTIGGRVYRK